MALGIGASSGHTVPVWSAWVPGLPRRLAGDSRGAVVLAGGWLAALTAGVLGWGTTAGVAVLLVAVVAHVASAADVVRLRAFPEIGPALPWWWGTAVVGVGGYGPLAWLALGYAWPAGAGDGRQYVVDRWAYVHNEPRPGDWAWLPRGEGGGPAWVLAGPGSRIEWAGDRLVCNGRPIAFAPVDPASFPTKLSLRVPQGMVLVAAGAIAARDGGPELRLVPRSRLAGRAWAVSAPIWTRGPLAAPSF